MATQVDTLEVMETNQATMASKLVKKICTTKEDGSSLHLDLSIIIQEV